MREIATDIEAMEQMLSYYKENLHTLELKLHGVVGEYRKALEEEKLKVVKDRLKQYE
jgi:ppGpp synthetase/RelA/SpoT-type nucleotidyltranferase